VAVVAICPDDVAERSSPPLSSVQIPAEALGRRAVELLMAKLDGHKPPELTLLPPLLTGRFSV
jgi:DNA-binding LacI/PurR family transcriptional regulator